MSWSTPFYYFNLRFRHFCYWLFHGRPHINNYFLLFQMSRRLLNLRWLGLWRWLFLKGRQSSLVNRLRLFGRRCPGCLLLGFGYNRFTGVLYYCHDLVKFYLNVLNLSIQGVILGGIYLLNRIFPLVLEFEDLIVILLDQSCVVAPHLSYWRVENLHVLLEGYL